uniref:Uncharacterized protein n=1 Tax=Phlebotomus papatasi TaxID=29031 RepID=A0A1B0D5B5_PHLPP
MTPFSLTSKLVPLLPPGVESMLAMMDVRRSGVAGVRGFFAFAGVVGGLGETGTGTGSGSSGATGGGSSCGGGGGGGSGGKGGGGVATDISTSPAPPPPEVTELLLSLDSLDVLLLPEPLPIPPPSGRLDLSDDFEWLDLCFELDDFSDEP